MEIEVQIQGRGPGRMAASEFVHGLDTYRLPSTSLEGRNLTLCWIAVMSNLSFGADRGTGPPRPRSRNHHFRSLRCGSSARRRLFSNLPLNRAMPRPSRLCGLKRRAGHYRSLHNRPGQSRRRTTNKRSLPPRLMDLRPKGKPPLNLVI